MTVFLAHRPPFRHAGRALLLSVGMFGISMAVFGMTSIPIVSFLALAASGAFDAISVIIRTTILQLYVPEHLRGRVFAVNMVFVYSSNELGAFESGIAAALLGVVPSVVLGGICSCVIAMIFAKKFPELRALGRMSVDSV